MIVSGIVIALPGVRDATQLIPKPSVLGNAMGAARRACPHALAVFVDPAD